MERAEPRRVPLPRIDSYDVSDAAPAPALAEEELAGGEEGGEADQEDPLGSPVDGRLLGGLWQQDVDPGVGVRVPGLTF